MPQKTHLFPFFLGQLFLCLETIQLFFFFLILPFPFGCDSNLSQGSILPIWLLALGPLFPVHLLNIGDLQANTQALFFSSNSLLTLMFLWLSICWGHPYQYLWLGISSNLLHKVAFKASPLGWSTRISNSNNMKTLNFSPCLCPPNLVLLVGSLSLWKAPPST